MPLSPPERVQMLGHYAPLGSPPEFGTETRTWGVRVPGYTDEVAERGPVLVSQYLSRGLQNPAIQAGLDRLETSLRTALQRREANHATRLLPAGLPRNYQNILTHLPSTSGTDPRRVLIHHLLRDELLRPLTAAGFQFDQGLVRPIGFIPPNSFYGHIALRRHMKDVLVGQDHGEWTHLLQWYLLTVSPPATPPGVTFRPAEVFEYLGRQGALQRTPAYPNPGPDLWFLCCDRVSVFIPERRRRASDAFDCRSPDMLNLGLAGFAPSRDAAYAATIGAAGAAELANLRNQLATSRGRWPLLCALLQRRAAKRDELLTRGMRFARQVATSMGPTIGAELYTAAPVSVAKLLPLAQQDRLIGFIVGAKDLTGHHLWLPNWSYLRLQPGAVLDNTDLNNLLNAIWPTWQHLTNGLRENSQSLLYAWSKQRAIRWNRAPGADLLTQWNTALTPAQQTALLHTAGGEAVPPRLNPVAPLVPLRTDPVGAAPGGTTP